MEVLSAELALVDEVLASAARLALPDRDERAPRSVGLIQAYRKKLRASSPTRSFTRRPDASRAAGPESQEAIFRVSPRCVQLARSSFTPSGAKRPTPATPPLHNTPK